MKTVPDKRADESRLNASFVPFCKQTRRLLHFRQAFSKRPSGVPGSARQACTFVCETWKIVCYSELDPYRAIRTVLMHQVAKGNRRETLPVPQCRAKSLPFAQNTFHSSFRLSCAVGLSRPLRQRENGWPDFGDMVSRMRGWLKNKGQRLSGPSG